MARSPKNAAKVGGVDAVAKRLAHCKERVFLAWEKEVLVLIAAEQGQARWALRDDLPVFFDELVAALLNREILSPKARMAGVRHGRERAAAPQYTLNDLIVEYRILRRILFQILSEKERVGEEARNILSESIDLAIELAACEFVKRRDENDSRRELEYLEHDERYRAIYDQAASGIMLVGLDGRWIDANQKFCELLGYRDEELRGKSFRDFSHPEDVDISLEQMNRLASGEVTSYTIEKRYLRKNGSVVWIEGTVSLVRDQELKPKYFLAVISDIDGRKELEAQVVEAKDAAESANRLKTAFLANVSHEIRTPLGAILGFTDLLKSNALSTIERLEYLEIIERSGRALTRVIDDVLDLSKVEAGRLEVELLAFSLPRLLEEVVALFRDQAKNKGVRLELESTRSFEFITSDPTRLRQILINIVGNEIKFTSAGSVSISHELKTLTAGQYKFMIRVVDTGLGLSEEQVSHLFLPFSQADNSTTRRFGGTGLGLTLSRRLARALGGDVIVEKFAPDSGCTFMISFLGKMVAGPSPETLEVAGIASNRAIVRRRLEGLRVLVVDDSADNRFLVNTYLAREGARVDEATDGREGVSKALSEIYSVILMDIQMPFLDGYQAVAELRQKGYLRPVLALTAHAMNGEHERSLRAGFTDHLSKPLEPSLLVEKVERYGRQ